jgi:adenylate cyclase
MRLIAICVLLAFQGVSPLYAQLQGQALIDSLLYELPHQKEDTNKVSLLNDLSSSYETINTDEGIKYGMAELALATKLNWKTGMAWACDELGAHFKSKSDYPSTLQYFSSALQYYEEIGDKKGIARITCNMGNVYNSQGNYPKAVKYLLTALKLDEEYGFKQYAANVTCNLGSIYSSNNDYEKSLEYSFKALKIFEEMGFKRGIAAVTCNIGGNYQSLNQNTKALEYFFEALKLDEEGGFREFSAIVTNNIGKNYTLQKNYTMAIDYFERSLKISEEIGDKQSMAQALVSIGGVYIDLLKSPNTSVGKIGRKSEVGVNNSTSTGPISMSRSELIIGALTYLQQSLEISKEINAQAIMEKCYKGLAEIYKLKGDYRRSLDATENWHAIKDSVFSQENKEEILKMSMKNDYDRQRLTDSLKAAEKQSFAAINLQKQRSYTYMGLAGILLLVGFSFFLFKERAKSEKLLLNILPAEVAKELKAKGNAEAKLINDVTVLFTDFKGFTQLSEKLSPKELVGEINTCFSAFDNIMQKHGVEKIKTIGDAYMAAGGLPTPNRTHAEDVIKAALDIQSFMHRHKAEREAEGKLFFEIRIGVHTGPVVAGIVGIKKFAYDIWGDTVNTASRMESSGSVGKVNISETTYEMVKDKFACAYRGEVEAKGKGVMKMYFVS